MRSRLSISAAALVGTLAAGLVTPVAQAGITIDPNAVPGRTQVTLRYSNGAVVSTANSHESRPALSLVKLYLGYWVLQHGAPADKARVENMIRFSEDGTATDLDRRYPQAIPEIIGQFGLHETHYPGFWGNTTTSTEDLARFTSAIVGDPLATPIINGMRTASPLPLTAISKTLAPHACRVLWARSSAGTITATSMPPPPLAMALPSPRILMARPPSSPATSWVLFASPLTASAIRAASLPRWSSKSSTSCRCSSTTQPARQSAVPKIQ